MHLSRSMHFHEHIHSHMAHMHSHIPSHIAAPSGEQRQELDEQAIAAASLYAFAVAAEKVTKSGGTPCKNLLRLDKTGYANKKKLTLIYQ